VKRERPRAVAELLVDAMPQLRERLVAERVRRAWSGLVGPDVARHAWPQSVSNGCLHVFVDNSPWLHELTLRAAELAPRVAARFDTVRSLRFTLGRVEGAPEPPPPARPARVLGPDDVREIDETVAPIRDPEVRAAARRLLGTARRAVK
jgi:predicted nucleic acid-binding Zn ribbon protein